MPTGELILATGAQRSGVSMMGGVVWLCGARGGTVVRGRRYDGRGAFENSEIHQSVVKPFIKGMGADTRGQDPLPDIQRCHDIAPGIAPSWRRRVDMILQAEVPDAPRVFFASAHSALIWPIWAAAYPKARWVIVRRTDEEIIKACENTNWMTGHDDAEGWQGWLDAYKARFREMAKHLPVHEVWPRHHEVWPRDMIGGDLDGLEAMIDFCGLTWNRQAVTDFVAPILWLGGIFQAKGKQKETDDGNDAGQ